LPPYDSRTVSPAIRFGMFVTGLLWLVVASVASGSAAHGICGRLAIPSFEPLLHAGFELLLLMVGFASLRYVSERAGDVRSTNELPRRATQRKEWAMGAALGWALAVAAALVLLLFRMLDSTFWVTPRSLGLTVLSVATVALASLASEVAFRGYLYRMLTESFGRPLATVVLCTAYALAVNFGLPSGSLWSYITTLLFGLLFSVAYVRTRALWFGWGLHFAWMAVVGVLFGMNLAGDGTLSTFVTTDLSGPAVFAGGGFGPEGSLITAVLVLAAIPVLYQVTKDFAWEYAAPVLVPGGYPMEAQPPAAHVAMEAQARPVAAPLVQILGATPTEPSTMRAVTEHLRSDGENGSEN